MGRALAGLLVAGLMLGGCQTDGAPFAESGIAPPVAFDRIDGLPRPAFDQLVESLSTAAETQKVDVVSRKMDAPYRVTGAFSLNESGRTFALAYTWDVLGKDGARVAQLTGEEPLGTLKAGTDPWAACDAAVLAKVADRTMTELAQTVSNGASGAMAAAEPAPAASAPAAPTPAAPGRAVRAAGLVPPPDGASPASLAYAGR